MIDDYFSISEFEDEATFLERRNEENDYRSPYYTIDLQAFETY